MHFFYFDEPDQSYKALKSNEVYLNTTVSEYAKTSFYSGGSAAGAKIYFLERKKFLNYFEFWSFKFFVSSQIYHLWMTWKN